MEQPLFREKEQKVNRPVFLTVLCILTWIGSVLLFVVAGLMVSRFGFIISQRDFPLHRMNYHSEMYWMLVAAIVNCICALVCFFGSLKMWRLQRSGFYFYVFGQILPVIVTISVITSFNGMKPLGSLMLFLYAAFPGIFILLYMVNLKHMHRTIVNSSAIDQEITKE